MNFQYPSLETNFIVLSNLAKSLSESDSCSTYIGDFKNEPKLVFINFLLI